MRLPEARASAVTKISPFLPSAPARMNSPLPQPTAAEPLARLLLQWGVAPVPMSSA